MRIELVCPAPPGSRTGNRITALRWARQLRSLGHRVSIEHEPAAAVNDHSDLMIAMHAKKSASALRRFKKRFSDRPLIVALTGTDLYRDLRNGTSAPKSLQLSDRIVLLQKGALRELAPGLRKKSHVILQSSQAPTVSRFDRARAFRVCAVGHMRAVKDPMRAALALRNLPTHSKIRLDQLGAALSSRYSEAAQREERQSSRYRWLGDRSHAEARRHIARCHLLVSTSRIEGGANVISEACVANTPVLATRIPGTAGLLGADYPGLFDPGDTDGLRELLLRCEEDAVFYSSLELAVASKAKLFRPEREVESWRALLRSLSPSKSTTR